MLLVREDNSAREAHFAKGTCIVFASNLSLIDADVLEYRTVSSLPIDTDSRN